MIQKIGESGELPILLKVISSFRKQYLCKQKKPTYNNPEKIRIKTDETAQKFLGKNSL